MVTRLSAVFLLVAVVAGSPPARGRAFSPPRGEIFAGVAGQPVSAYQQAVGKHPPVYEVFTAWGEYLPGIFQDAERARARLMISLTTASGLREMVTPGAIARGQGDAWLVALGRAAYDSGLVTYVRLMPEMDGYWNPYSAFGPGGPRDRDHSAAAFKRAWQRVTLILRGGSATAIDARLRKLGMPPLRTTHDLPRPRVAMLWVPQVAGAPDLPGNQPRDYWPGRQWVDWVGTDFYSKFPNFTGLTGLYDAYPRQPFLFGEYALWGSDDASWVRQLFGWIRSHPRARMLIYNQGLEPGGPFRLSRYPGAARALRSELTGPRFPAYAPEWAGVASR